MSSSNSNYTPIKEGKTTINLNQFKLYILQELNLRTKITSLNQKYGLKRIKNEIHQIKVLHYICNRVGVKILF